MEDSLTDKKPKPTEREKLELEKMELAKELKIWDEFDPAEGYKETPQHKRIDEIDKKLWELVK
jgi:hypothetical protein